jgi:hypothetical protein
MQFLKRPLLKATTPLWVSTLLEAELAALERLDIPWFGTHTESCDLLTDTGTVLPNLFALSALEQARLHLSLFDEEDCDHQVDLIRATFLSFPSVVLSSQHPLVRQARLDQWPRRSLALLAGTWLGDALRPTPLSMSREASIYSKQADAVLYLGPGELLTASRADPALYLAGDYVTELQHFQQIADHLSLRFESSPMDLLAEGLKRARSGPAYFQTKS